MPDPAITSNRIFVEQDDLLELYFQAARIAVNLLDGDPSVVEEYKARVDSMGDVTNNFAFEQVPFQLALSLLGKNHTDYSENEFQTLHRRYQEEVRQLENVPEDIPGNTLKLAWLGI